MCRQVVEDFRYTNGETPFRYQTDDLGQSGGPASANGSALGAVPRQQRRVARSVIETHAGEIRISTDLCWCALLTRFVHSLSGKGGAGGTCARHMLHPYKRRCESTARGLNQPEQTAFVRVALTSTCSTPTRTATRRPPPPRGVPPPPAVPVPAPRTVGESYSHIVPVRHRYLDSQFCASFHAFKRSSSPQTVHTVGLAVLFILWSLAMTAMLLRLLGGFCRQVQLPGHVTPAERAYACVEIFAKQTALGTAGRLMLLMLPWPFYQVCLGREGLTRGLRVACASVASC